MFTSFPGSVFNTIFDESNTAYTFTIGFYSFLFSVMVWITSLTNKLNNGRERRHPCRTLFFCLFFNSVLLILLQIKHYSPAFHSQFTLSKAFSKSTFKFFPAEYASSTLFLLFSPCSKSKVNLTATVYTCTLANIIVGNAL